MWWTKRQLAALLRAHCHSALKYNPTITSYSFIKWSGTIGTKATSVSKEKSQAHRIQKIKTNRKEISENLPKLRIIISDQKLRFVSVR
jgi:hypothetical protein